MASLWSAVPVGSSPSTPNTTSLNVVIPRTLSDVIVAIPVMRASVAAIPPTTWKASVGTVVPTPTRPLDSAATRRFSFTSRPFLITKLLLIAIWVHSPPVHYFFYYLSVLIVHILPINKNKYINCSRPWERSKSIEIILICRYWNIRNRWWPIYS